MSTLEIEIDPNLDSQQWRQDFEGTTYLVKVVYNTREGQYQIELSDTDGDLIASSPLVFGVILFSEYADSRLPPGKFIMIDATGEGGPADQDTVGRNVKLFYVESE